MRLLLALAIVLRLARIRHRLARATAAELPELAQHRLALEARLLALR